MTRRVPCPPAPGPLEGYAARFDDLFGSLAQRRGSGSTWPGCWRRRSGTKTLTALAGAEPVAGAQHRSVQRLQFFLSESRWDPEQVNARRLELLRAGPAFRTKLAIGADLAVRARDVGFAFRAVAADSAELVLPSPSRRGRPRVRPGRVLADKAYSARAIRSWLRARGIRATIPVPGDQASNRVAAAHAVAGRPPLTGSGTRTGMRWNAGSASSMRYPG
jgi:hypothetical protein